MHAVGPRKFEYKDNKKFDDALYKTFLNCLERAHKNKHESIAVPAISAGIWSVDSDPFGRKTMLICENKTSKY